MRTRTASASYNKEADVLYVATTPGKHAVVQESAPGVLWRIEPDTGEIVGVTIMDRLQYWGPRLNELLLALQDGLSIDEAESRKLLNTATG